MASSEQLASLATLHEELWKVAESSHFSAVGAPESPELLLYDRISQIQTKGYMATWNAHINRYPIQVSIERSDFNRPQLTDFPTVSYGIGYGDYGVRMQQLLTRCRLKDEFALALCLSKIIRMTPTEQVLYAEHTLNSEKDKIMTVRAERTLAAGKLISRGLDITLGGENGYAISTRFSEPEGSSPQAAEAQYSSESAQLVSSPDMIDGWMIDRSILAGRLAVGVAARMVGQ